MLLTRRGAALMLLALFDMLAVLMLLASKLAALQQRGVLIWLLRPTEI